MGQVIMDGHVVRADATVAPHGVSDPARANLTLGEAGLATPVEMTQVMFPDGLLKAVMRASATAGPANTAKQTTTATRTPDTMD
jgi:hypothetical protein